MKKYILKEASLKNLLQQFGKEYSQEQITALYDADKSAGKQFASRFFIWLTRTSTSEFPNFMREVMTFMELYLEKYTIYDLTPDKFKDFTTIKNAIDYLKSLTDIMPYINKGVKNKLGEIVGENKEWIAIYIPTYEASKYFGTVGLKRAEDAPWCIVNSYNYWIRPAYAGDKIYMFKKNDSKHRLALIINGVHESSLWNKEDEDVAHGIDAIYAYLKKNTKLEISMLDKTFGKRDPQNIKEFIVAGEKKKLWQHITSNTNTYYLLIPTKDDANKVLLDGFEPDGIPMLYLIDKNFSNIKSVLTYNKDTFFVKKFSKNKDTFLRVECTSRFMVAITNTEISQKGIDYFTNFLIKNLFRPNIKETFLDVGGKLVATLKEKIEPIFDTAFVGHIMPSGLYLFYEKTGIIYKLYRAVGSPCVATVMPASWLDTTHSSGPLNTILSKFFTSIEDRKKFIALFAPEDTPIKNIISQAVKENLCYVYAGEGRKVNETIIAPKGEEGIEFFSKLIGQQYLDGLFLVVLREGGQHVFYTYDTNEKTISMYTVNPNGTLMYVNVKKNPLTTMFSNTFNIHTVPKIISFAATYYDLTDYLEHSIPGSKVYENEDVIVFKSLNGGNQLNFNLTENPHGIIAQGSNLIALFIYNKKDRTKRYIIKIGYATTLVFDNTSEKMNFQTSKVFTHKPFIAFLKKALNYTIVDFYKLVKSSVVSTYEVGMYINGTQYLLSGADNLMVLNEQLGIITDTIEPLHKDKLIVVSLDEPEHYQGQIKEGLYKFLFANKERFDSWLASFSKEAEADMIEQADEPNLSVGDWYMDGNSYWRDSYVLQKTQTALRMKLAPELLTLLTTKYKNVIEEYRKKYKVNVTDFKRSMNDCLFGELQNYFESEGGFYLKYKNSQELIDKFKGLKFLEYIPNNMTFYYDDKKHIEIVRTLIEAKTKEPTLLLADACWNDQIVAKIIQPIVDGISKQIGEELVICQKTIEEFAIQHLPTLDELAKTFFEDYLGLDFNK